MTTADSLLPEDPFVVLLLVICIVDSLSAVVAATLLLLLAVNGDDVVVALVTAPVTADVLASDIGFDPLPVAAADDWDGNGWLSDFFARSLLVILELLFVGVFVEGDSLLVGTGVGVVLVEVVVVVISLNVEPAIETMGVSGIMAAANDETATATTTAAFGGVVAGR